MIFPERDPVEFCLECGWRHANIEHCWRKTLRKAREMLADPATPEDIRGPLRVSVDELESEWLETIAFLQGLAMMMEESL